MARTKCKTCNAEFYVRPSTLKNNHGLYCNSKCRFKNAALYKTGNKFCFMCNKLFPVSIQYFYKNKHKASGYSDECKPCKRKYQQGRHLELRERKREFIRSRGSKCEHCGIYYENTSFFDIDHIIPVKITKETRNPNITDFSNLQILCPNCHRTKNIKEQFRGIPETQGSML